MNGPIGAADAVAVTVRGPLTGQGAVAERILRALPGWFGIEESVLAYVRAADEHPTFVAECGGEAAGFVTVKRTSDHAAELHALGVLPGRHRRGVGRALVERAAAHAAAEGCGLLHVKTLAPSHPDPGYAATRAFYETMGFLPLEELPHLWGPDDPCLIMVRCLRAGTAP
jgi:GNAT superfamily N-acetyltransferase